MKILCTFCLGLLITTQSTFSRTAVPCLDVPTSEILDQTKVKERIIQAPYYKKIKESYSIRKIAFHSCRNDLGLIDVADESASFKGKQCALSNFDFYFTVKKEEILFAKVNVDGKEMGLLDYKEHFLKKTIEKTFDKDNIKSFLSKIKNCQVKLVREGDLHKLFFNLKNEDGDFCFYHSDLSGEKIQLIRRLYAKDNRCEQKS